MKLTGKQVVAWIIAIVVILVGGFTIYHFNSGSNNQTENSQKNSSSQSSTSFKKATNEENTEGLAKALKKKNLKFKIATGDTWDEFGVVWITTLMTDRPSTDRPKNDDGSPKQNEYGFNQPTKGGTSIMAYASQQKLNKEQAEAMDYVVGGAEDKNGDGFEKIYKHVPDVFTENHYPKEGISFDYVTVSNVKISNVKKSDERYKGYKQISADITVHIRNVDGKKETALYHGSTIPNAGNTPLDKDDVKKANHAKIMNKPVPNKDVLGFSKDEDSSTE
ncbi:hypothetical protein [Pediococcus pentosaceus]|uniref:hypothetical protein n=1 Tax=Lactobacillaceae TaxID=33958 RepID=UPI002E38090C|nr:hypothetical protein [Pediococcus pentosaceus]